MAFSLSVESNSHCYYRLEFVIQEAKTFLETPFAETV